MTTEKFPQELIVIHGRSVTGKSALGNSLRPLVEADGGFFLSGTFDSSGLQEPYAVFASAFSCFAPSLLAKNASTNNHASPGHDCCFHQMRDSIQEAVGKEGKLLTDMIPSLEDVIGRQTQTRNIRGLEALR